MSKTSSERACVCRTWLDTLSRSCVLSALISTEVIASVSCTLVSQQKGQLMSVLPELSSYDSSSFVCKSMMRILRSWHTTINKRPSRLTAKSFTRAQVQQWTSLPSRS